ncbi:hypothetical protein C8R42DRAFT_272935 [Lentinula raphanica]|nr:hypothetical protein C8R42DRAFT_272935 [Lentinula raphanica]
MHFIRDSNHLISTVALILCFLPMRLMALPLSHICVTSASILIMHSCIAHEQAQSSGVYPRAARIYKEEINTGDQPR